MNKCYFCGEPFDNGRIKSKEHILPKWLLKMTGDPGRIVPMGYSYKDKRELEFAFDKLTIPACIECNEFYGFGLEGKAKNIIENIIEKREITSVEAEDLLDWLDKVRVGLWFNYSLIERKIEIEKARFHISDRIGSKDRFLRIYFLKFDSEDKGLNAFGVNTYLFQLNPTLFALKINNILILNGSSDFLITENSKYAVAPIIKDGIFGGYSCNDDTIDPNVIANTKFEESDLFLIQLINNENILKHAPAIWDQKIIKGESDNLRKSHIISIDNTGNTNIHNSNNLPIKYNNEWTTNNKYIGEILSKIYEAQIENYRKWSVENIEEEFFKENEFYIKFYKNIHKQK